MAARDWYRSREWSEDIAERFQRRLARSRSPYTRWSALRTQAMLLFGSHPEVCRALLIQSTELQGAEPGLRCVSEQHLAELAWTQGDRSEALVRLHAAVATCAVEDRGIRRSLRPEEQLARVSWLAGEPSALALLPPLRAGLDHWGEVDPTPSSALGEPYTSPEESAHALLVGLDGEPALEPVRAALYAWDAGALAALDAVLVCQPLREVFAPFDDQGRYELPALLATCAVRAPDARVQWRPGGGLLDWRLVPVGDDSVEAIDPWWCSWRLLDVGWPLGAVTQILGRRRSGPAGLSQRPGE